MGGVLLVKNNSKSKSFFKEFQNVVDKDNNLIWHLWEKWHTKEDYQNYISTPPRSKTSKFMEVFNTGVFEFSSVHVSQPSNHLVKY